MQKGGYKRPVFCIIYRKVNFVCDAADNMKIQIDPMDSHVP